MPRLWLLFSQTMKNLDLVNTVYLTLQKSSAELKQLVRQSVVTKPLCDLPDMDLKRVRVNQTSRRHSSKTPTDRPFFTNKACWRSSPN